MRGTEADDEREWNELAGLDLRFGIHTDAQAGAWDASQASYLATGEAELARVMSRLEGLGRPAQRHDALDFGCGLGRTARGLATRFDRVLGMDVSARLVQAASEVNAECGNCSFTTNDLESLQPGSFDLVYCASTLQHITPRGRVVEYLREFLRVVRDDGVVVIDVPRDLTWTSRLQLRRRLYRTLRRLGASPAWLYERLGVTPVAMVGFSQRRIHKLFDAAGATVIAEFADQADSRRLMYALARAEGSP